MEYHIDLFCINCLHLEVPCWPGYFIFIKYIYITDSNFFFNNLIVFWHALIGELKHWEIY